MFVICFLFFMSTKSDHVKINLGHKLQSVKTFGTVKVEDFWNILAEEYYIMCKEICTKTIW